MLQVVHLEASMAVPPLKGLWPIEKAAQEHLHLESTVAVDKSMPHQVCP